MTSKLRNKLKCEIFDIFRLSTQCAVGTWSLVLEIWNKSTQESEVFNPPQQQQEEEDESTNDDGKNLSSPSPHHHRIGTR